MLIAAHVEWRDKFLAEPQLEVYERAIELVRLDTTRFSCCAIYNAIKEMARIDLESVPWLVTHQLDAVYNGQFREMWCAGASPFWWGSLNYLHIGWKTKALELLLQRVRRKNLPSMISRKMWRSFESTLRFVEDRIFGSC